MRCFPVWIRAVSLKPGGLPSMAFRLLANIRPARAPVRSQKPAVIAAVFHGSFTATHMTKSVRIYSAKGSKAGVFMITC